MWPSFAIILSRYLYYIIYNIITTKVKKIVTFLYKKKADPIKDLPKIFKLDM